MKEPKNYRKMSYSWDTDSLPKKAPKKCCCPYGYKCSCRGGEAPEKVFDLVDEMELRHGLKRR